MKKICCVFNAVADFNIEDIETALNIKWEDVSQYHIKWMVFYITMKDGRSLQHDVTHLQECEDFDIDVKRPTDTFEYED